MYIKVMENGTDCSVIRETQWTRRCCSWQRFVKRTRQRCGTHKNTISLPGELPYTHRTVNHSRNFVEPGTGVNTQRIERKWRDVKKKLLRDDAGNRHLLTRRLAEFWWKHGNVETPFLDLLAEIAHQYPQR